ncbi:ABC transporter substrate-binding protein [Pseudactinotalea sp. HY158]|uniref:ABC transporter substrate-binding protein n=1 Tax=Pseudactinotalea sp. HY158 TaxID=2654547 RepID=UPI00129C52BC|nr:ABC transporter substrate-binding protein [Pseudactinotalea sp. HY158]QGH70697.1 PhnD/SsuA/transferrin family substrate-binding protein [Pseudactinotalea sp. HY158]
MRTKLITATFAGSLVLALGACGSSDSSGADGLTPVDIGLAVEKDGANMALVIADEQGIYEKCGLDATITFFQGGGALMPALAAGEVGYGWVATTAVVSAVEEGADISTIAEVNRTAAGWGLVVAEDSPIQTLDDLQSGATISFTSEGALSQWFALWSMQQAGLSADDMTGVPLGGSVPAIGSALDKGDIDAAVVLLPWGHMLEDDGKRWVSRYDEELPDFSFTGIHAGADALEDEATAAKVVGAYVEAVAWLEENPGEAKEFISRFYDLDAEKAQVVYDLVVPDYNPTGQLDPQRLQSMLDTVGEIPGFVEGTLAADQILHQVEPATCS